MRTDKETIDFALRSALDIERSYLGSIAGTDVDPAPTEELIADLKRVMRRRRISTNDPAEATNGKSVSIFESAAKR